MREISLVQNYRANRAFTNVLGWTGNRDGPLSNPPACGSRRVFCLYSRGIRFFQLFLFLAKTLYKFDSNNQSVTLISRDEDPVLVKNRIRGPAPQTKGDFELIF